MDDKEVLVSNAIMAEHAERYMDMAKYMKSFTEVAGDISNDERNVLSIAYKHLVGERRNAWRIVSSMEKGYEESDFRKKVAHDYRSEIAAEQKSICEEVLFLIESYLLPNTSDFESKIVYLKMKGDYYRYLAEVKEGDETRTQDVKESQGAYEEAYLLSKQQMPPSHPIHLGLALNYSVFHYEILGQTEKACEIASSAFDLAVETQDEEGLIPSDDNHKDTMLILQLLRDNLTLWTSEIKTEKN